MNGKNKKKQVMNDKLWLLLSFCAALVVWYLLSLGKRTGNSFPYIPVVIEGLQTMIERGAFWTDLSSSLTSIRSGIHHRCAGRIPDGLVHAGA